MCAMYLGADHGEGLTLRGVDLAGHDAAARLVLRQLQLSQPTARPAAQKTNVVCHLHAPRDVFVVPLPLVIASQGVHDPCKPF